MTERRNELSRSAPYWSPGPIAMPQLLALKVAWLWLTLLTLGGWHGKLVFSADAKQLAPVQLWADFGSASYLPNEQAGIRSCRKDGDLFCGLTDSDAAFVSKTYSVISLEKCFGVRPGNTNQSNHTETNFVKTATQIARLAPQGRPAPQVLFYWSSNVAVADCYEDATGGLILEHPDWFLRTALVGTSGLTCITSANAHISTSLCQQRQPGGFLCRLQCARSPVMR